MFAETTIDARQIPLSALFEFQSCVYAKSQGNAKDVPHDCQLLPLDQASFGGNQRVCEQVSPRTF